MPERQHPADWSLTVDDAGFARAQAALGSLYGAAGRAQESRSELLGDFAQLKGSSKNPIPAIFRDAKRKLRFPLRFIFKRLGA